MNMPTVKSANSKSTSPRPSQSEELKSFDAAAARLFKRVKEDKAEALKFLTAIGYFEIMPEKAVKDAYAKLGVEAPPKTRRAKRGK